MKIRCPVGKGIIEADACLACALKNVLPPCGMEHSFLRKMYKAMDQDRPGIHVSDIIHCLRRSYLDKADPQPEAPHEMLAKFYGLAMHDYLDQGNGDHGEIDVEYEGLVGRVDLFEDGILRDYKTTKKIYADLLPYGEHAMQQQVYAFMLEQSGHQVARILLVYISKFGPTECSKCKLPVEVGIFGEMSCPRCGSTPRNSTFGVKTIEVLKESPAFMKKYIDERKGILEKARDSGPIPDGEPSWQCKYCQHLCPWRDGGNGDDRG
jgi:CRISPR/Cas system-associated exonuclease Cas4 (RecB family)